MDQGRSLKSAMGRKLVKILNMPKGESPENLAEMRKVLVQQEFAKAKSNVVELIRNAQDEWDYRNAGKMADEDIWNLGMVLSMTGTKGAHKEARKDWDEATAPMLNQDDPNLIEYLKRDKADQERLAGEEDIWGPVVELPTEKVIELHKINVLPTVYFKHILEDRRYLIGNGDGLQWNLAAAMVSTSEKRRIILPDGEFKEITIPSKLREEGKELIGLRDEAVENSGYEGHRNEVIERKLKHEEDYVKWYIGEVAKEWGL